MKQHPFINALKPYTGKVVIAVDFEDVMTGPLSVSEDFYLIGNYPVPDWWAIDPKEILAVTPVPELDTVVIRVTYDGARQ